MQQTLRYTDAKSDKFWRIETLANQFVVNYGKYGCGGLIVFAPRQFAQDFAQSLATSRMQAIWLPHAMTLPFSKKR